MSYLKLLSLAVVVGASSSFAAVVDNDEHGRALQASLLCIIGGQQSVLECCDGVTDGICTLLTCIDLNSVTVVDGCNCGQIETACTGVAGFATFVPQITGMCDQVNECCDEGTTTNGEFNTCFVDAISGGLEIPDFASILPGGLPDLGLGPELVDPVDTTTTATVAAATTTDGATEAPADTTVGAGTTEVPVDATTTVGATEAPATTEAPADATTTEAPADATTTEAPADATTTEAPPDATTTVGATEAPADTTVSPGPTEPDAGSDASKFAISTATSLVVASLAMIFA